MLEPPSGPKHTMKNSKVNQHLINDIDTINPRLTAEARLAAWNKVANLCQENDLQVAALSALLVAYKKAAPNLFLKLVLAAVADIDEWDGSFDGELKLINETTAWLAAAPELQDIVEVA